MKEERIIFGVQDFQTKGNFIPMVAIYLSRESEDNLKLLIQPSELAKNNITKEDIKEILKQAYESW